MTTETKLVRFDWAMKNLLRDKANFDILEGFLSAVLGDEIKVLQIFEREIGYFEKEINYLDVLVQDSKQRNLVIDIQNHFMVAPYLLESILSGGTKALTNNMEQNQDYREVGKVISIGILHFDVGLGKDYLYYGNTEFRGLHDNQSPIFQRRELDETLEKFKSQDIFPEYYLINVERFADEIKTDLDEWIYLFKHAALPPHCHAKNIDKAREKLEVSKIKPEERHHYDLYLMTRVNERDKFNLALNTGLQQGRQEGEDTKARKIAKKMLAKGMDIETIVAMTDLSPDIIQQEGKSI
jgi:predicted transposase/invertase (TIGR01784 family)